LRWDNAKRWPASEAADYSQFALEVGDIILAMDRPWIEAGLKWAWVTEEDVPSLLVQRVSRLRGAAGLCTGFLRYIVASQGFTGYIRPIVTGVSVPHVSGLQIQDFRFRLPPMDVQRKITSILSAYDYLIENNLRRIKILEEMAQSLYKEWFLDFRFPGREGVALVDSSLGPVPERWTVESLGRSVDVDKGVSYKGEYLTDDGTPMVNLKCFRPEGGFSSDGLKGYSGPLKQHQLVKPGEVVVANTDLTQAGNIVGSAGIVPCVDGVETMAFTHHVYAVRPKISAGLPSLYLYHLLLTPEYKAFARGRAIGTTVLGLAREGVLDFLYARPPRSLMETFEGTARDLYELTQNLLARIALARQTRDLLLPKLISGEIDVSDLDINVGEDAA